MPQFRKPTYYRTIHHAVLAFFPPVANKPSILDVVMKLDSRTKVPVGVAGRGSPSAGCSPPSVAWCRIVQGRVASSASCSPPSPVPNDRTKENIGAVVVA